MWSVICNVYELNPVSFVYGGIGSGNCRTADWRFCMSVKNDVYTFNHHHTQRDAICRTIRDSRYARHLLC